MAAVHGCPGDLDATSKARWRLIKKFIEDDRGWEDVYHVTLERHIRARERYDRINELLAREGLMTEGSKGQPAAHPLLRELANIERVLDVTADKLLLTPSARAKLNEEPKVAAGKFAGAFG